MTSTRSDPPWYADGLRFSCTECGTCCRVEGHVWVDEQEIEEIAHHLGLELDAFGRRYLRRIGRRLSLTEKPTFECVFWNDGCTIYAARPRQCRTFPFWSDQVATPETWAEVAKDCEGIGKGRLYSIGEIGALSRGKGATAAADERGGTESDS